MFRDFSVLTNGVAVFNLLPGRLLRNRPLDPTGDADFGIRLTCTQAKVHDALLAALLGMSPCVMLTGAAGLGKTTVLAAALSCIAKPERQVLRLDDVGGGIEEAFRALFALDRRPRRRRHVEQRLVLVVDQMEARPSGSVAYLELLSRMPGKTAPIQWVFVGRSERWDCLDGPAAAWLREASPACLALPALSEQDAWELFHHRVSPTCGLHSAAKLVTSLLKQSEGLPGRFDAAVRAAINAGLLQGVPAQAA